MRNTIEKGRYRNLGGGLNSKTKAVNQIYRKVPTTLTKGNSVCEVIKITKSGGRRGKGERL